MRLTLLACGICGVWANAADVGYFPAYYHSDGAGQSILTVFPLLSSKETVLALPTGLGTFNLISFGPDGRSAYLQEPSAFGALVKIELGPLRQSPVPGSAGLGDILP